MRYLASLALLLLASAVCGQDLSIQGDTKIVKVDRVIVVKEDRTVVSSLPFTVQAPPGGGLYFWSYPSGIIATDLGDSLKVTIAPTGDCTISVKMITADIDKDGKFKGFSTKFATISFAVGDVTPPTPLPPPMPPTPPVPPKPPTPVPVTSFRVIFILETAKTPTKEQISAMYGKDVRDYLAANTTKEGGQPGYRYWDQNTTAESESPTMKALWDAITPQITTLPCVAVEVNGKVEIIPLAATPAAMVATFAKYKGGN